MIRHKNLDGTFQGTRINFYLQLIIVVWADCRYWQYTIQNHFFRFLLSFSLLYLGAWASIIQFTFVHWNNGLLFKQTNAEKKIIYENILTKFLRLWIDNKWGFTLIRASDISKIDPTYSIFGKAHREWVQGISFICQDARHWQVAHAESHQTVRCTAV
jgi:hypothetical protein